LQKSTNDIVMIYWWEGQWWWLERIAWDIKKYKNLWYKESQLNKNIEWIKILEKNWIRVIIINYDKFKNTDKIWEILKENKIKSDMFVFRWHNFYTSRMIKNLGNKILWKTVILDWWCRNFSQINEYRKKWINNGLIAYTSTWKWEKTLHIVNSFITFLRENKNKNKDIKITWQDFANKNIKSSYVKNYVKFPGNILDIILKIESE
jgi:hypothetical protein